MNFYENLRGKEVPIHYKSLIKKIFTMWDPVYLEEGSGSVPVPNNLGSRSPVITLIFFGVRRYRCPPDVIAANAELVQRDGVPILDRHLDRLQVCVHGHVHACDCAVNLNN
jgi:hypothetical protein